MAKKDFGDELFYEYNKWLVDKERKYMSEFIDKLIRVNLIKQNYKRFVDFNSESFVNEMHDIKLKCYQSLMKITAPTSKRIYNYLDCTIRYSLLHSRKELAKKIDQKKQFVNPESFEVQNLDYVDDHSLDYLSEEQQKFSELVLAGYTNDEMAEKLNTTKFRIHKMKKELKEILLNV